MQIQHQRKIGLTACVVLTALSLGISAKADEAGRKLLNEIIAKYKTAMTLSADVEIWRDNWRVSSVYTARLTLLKPNLVRFQPPVSKFLIPPIGRQEAAPVTIYQNSRLGFGNTSGEMSRLVVPEWNPLEDAPKDNFDDRNFLQRLFFASDTYSLLGLSTTPTFHGYESTVSISVEDASPKIPNAFVYRQLRITETLDSFRPGNVEKRFYDSNVIWLNIGRDGLVRSIWRTVTLADGTVLYSESQIFTNLRVNVPAADSDFAEISPRDFKLPALEGIPVVGDIY